MKCTETYSPEFLEEMRQLLGDEAYGHFDSAMRPSEHAMCARGNPPRGGGKRPIQPSYKLRRATEEQEGGAPAKSRASATLIDNSHTQWGPVPSYMFEDREQARDESAPPPLRRPCAARATPRAPSARRPRHAAPALAQMESLGQWFAQYGRPAERARQGMYTTYQPLHRRCCGEPSMQQVMKRGNCTQ